MTQFRLRTPADIGALIKDRRRALGLGQAELAERIGTKRLWVSQVERGKPGASLGLVMRALAAVGVDIWSGKTTLNQPDSAEKLSTPIDVNDIIAKAKRQPGR